MARKTTQTRTQPNTIPHRLKQAAWPVAIAALLLMLAVFPSGSASAEREGPFPGIIPLPNGFAPEGIAIGRGTQFYVGSIPTGAIYGGNLRNGKGDILVEGGQGRQAIGMKVDVRTNYLFVAGGPTGMAYVYDATNGAFLQEYQLADPGNFINDVTLTKNGAYFTNSNQALIYYVPLGPGGSLPDPSAVQAIPLGGDFQLVPNAFNSNGIDASPNGKWLIIVNSTLGTLYRVNPETGNADLIDLGGATVPNGDGILLVGRTLYVVQNQLNQIAVIEMDRDLLAGELVNTITDPNFRVPTTIARFGDFLYAVNARFGTPVEPDTEYEVVRVRR
jgi:sugar lactone lactonase YvrE